MKISAKYQRILETYLEWEHVKTPASGSFQESRKPQSRITITDDGLSAGEALCIWESYDNQYSRWEFYLDGLMQSKIESWGMSYFDRDDRDSSLKNAWRIVRIKWIDPAIWRLRGIAS